MQRAYVSIGSNIERETHIKAALLELEKQFSNLEASPVYESISVGFNGDNFYNLVAGFDTDLDPGQLKENLHAIETKYDRRRNTNRFSSRTLDLDVLLLGDLVYEKDGVCLPRKEIIEYAFVLQPLADIVGAGIHPVLGKSYAQLWCEFHNQDQTLWLVESDKWGG